MKQYSLFRIILLFFITIFGLPLVQGKDLMFSNSKPILVYDITLDNGKLRSYRNVTDYLHDPEKFANNNMQGFATLKISGSAQFSAQQLTYIFERSEGQLFILDLRQETHGFINERAFALRGYRNQVNIRKTPEQINEEEKKLLTKIARQQTVILHEIHKYADGSFIPIKDIEVKVKSAFTEQELIQQTQANYVRFYVLDKHKPDDEQVDAFVNFVKTLPNDAWLHFHCRAGKGRTTTFMVMYDIIRNAKQVAFKDILERHVLFSGCSTLNIFSTQKEKNWTVELAKARYKFLQKFYQYVIMADGYNKQSWSSWRNKT